MCVCTITTAIMQNLFQDLIIMTFSHGDHSQQENYSINYHYHHHHHNHNLITIIISSYLFQFLQTQGDVCGCASGVLLAQHRQKGRGCSETTLMSLLLV